MKLESALLPINHKKGRTSPFHVDVVVVHVTEGSESSVRSWFNATQAEVSAHYLVTRAGKIVQFVAEQDTAWHAGRTSNPTAAIVRERPGANVNGFSIGIEHEGTGKDELTDVQRQSSAWLIHDICTRRNIPITRRHIIGHREVFDQKTCPGKIDVDRLVHDAMARSDAPIPPPRIVWSAYLNDYLVVTRQMSDEDWEYVPIKNLPRARRGAASLALFPAVKP